MQSGRLVDVFRRADCAVEDAFRVPNRSELETMGDLFGVDRRHAFRHAPQEFSRAARDHVSGRFIVALSDRDFCDVADATNRIGVERSASESTPNSTSSDVPARDTSKDGECIGEIHALILHLDVRRQMTWFTNRP